MTDTAKRIPSLLDIAKQAQREQAEVALGAMTAAERAAALDEIDADAAPVPSKTTVREKRTADGKERRKRHDRESKAAKRAKPLPYAALAGRQLVARKRIMIESRKRRAQLVKALAKPDGDRVLIKLRNLDAERRFEVLTAWRVRELLRAETLREPKLREIAERMPRLKVSGAAKLTHVDRLLDRSSGFEASGVWKPFDLLRTA